MRNRKRISKFAKRYTAPLIGLVLSVFALWIQFFDPLDIVLSALRDKFRYQDTSGKIMIVTMPEPVPGDAAQALAFEQDLKRIILLADAQGAERIAVRSPVTEKISDWTGLNNSLDQSQVVIGFGVRAKTLTPSADTEITAISETARRARVIDEQNHQYWRGVEHFESGFNADGRIIASIEWFLSGQAGVTTQTVAIDYSLKATSLKASSVASLWNDPAQAAALKSKRLIIDFDRPGERESLTIPGQGRAAPAIVTALGAETLIAGNRFDIGPLPFFFLGWILLYGLKRIAHLGLRLATAIVAVSGMICVPVALETASVDVTMADGLIVFLVGTVWCLTSDLFKQSRARHERNLVTGFLTSSALKLQHDLGPSLIAVHVHNYLEIVSKHADGAERDFAGKIAERLMPGHRDAIFQGDDGYFFWSMPETETSRLDAHLRATALVLRNGIPFDGRAISLVVSFGVDQRVSAPASTRAAGSMSASLTAYEGGMDWHLFSQDDGQHVEEDAALAADLRVACAQGDIEVAFQPKLNVVHSTIDGYEALARWTHPVLGPVSPGRFIALAERYGIIEDLTFVVMRKAWSAHRHLVAQGAVLRGAINISPILLGSAASVDRLLAALDGSGVDPEQMIVEITESSSLTSIEQGRSFIERVRQRGIKVSMDDFGTGQSSLSLLRDLSFDEIKVDRQFALHAMVNPRDRAFLETTIMLAQRLGIACVVEGIEDHAGIRFVSALGGDYVQGYAVAKPMLESEFQHFLSDWASRPSRLQIA